MTPAEREALLKLWEDVPETRPNPRLSVDPISRGDCWMTPMGQVMDDHAAAIARDAMVGFLMKHNRIVARDGSDNSWSVWEFGSHDPVFEDQCESLMEVLVAACRKLTGKDSK